MRSRVLAAVAVLCIAGAGAPGQAQDRTLVILADERLAASGLLDYLLPRFALKHGLRPEVVTLPADGIAQALAGAAPPDVVIASDTALSDAALPEAAFPEAVATARPGSGAAFHETGGAASGPGWRVAQVGPSAEADAFVAWLTGAVGQRTLAAFDGPVRYSPGLAPVAPATAATPQAPGEGDRLAHAHCGRCHVVSARNRMGGIGSAPSFGALRAIPDWEAKFATFWLANPHPSFARIEDVSPPFRRAPHIAPIVLTLDEAEAIIAFAATIAPKDLGMAVESR